jgi:hypothetical protein
MAATTAAQKKAAKQLLEVASFNAQSTKDELNRANSIFDISDSTERAQAEKSGIDNSRQSAADRFSQMKKLQSSTRGIMASAGNAMNGSQTGNLIGALGARQDLDTGEAFGTLAQNEASVGASLTTALNQNENARRDAANKAALQIRNLEGQAAADLSTLNPSLYKKPGKGKGKVDLGSAAVATRVGAVPVTRASAAGYFMPVGTTKAAPVMQGNSYFDRLINQNNQRRA